MNEITDAEIAELKRWCSAKNPSRGIATITAVTELVPRLIARLRKAEDANSRPRAWYLATPYSKYPSGIEQAFRDACRETGLLIKAGVPVFSPIAHTHSVAMACMVDPLDHKIWLAADRAMMDAAVGIIVCKMEGWEQSFGISEELKVFRSANKPVVWMVPGVLPEIFDRQ